MLTAVIVAQAMAAQRHVDHGGCYSFCRRITGVVLPQMNERMQCDTTNVHGLTRVAAVADTHAPTHGGLRQAGVGIVGATKTTTTSRTNARFDSR